MKKIKNLKGLSLMALLLCSSLVSNLSYAQVSGSATANTKASATLSAVCTISSQAVNFGQIVLPVSTQSATSSMSVTCTKGSSYTIGLAYGGVYGQGGQSGTLTNTSASRATGGWICGYGGTVNGQYVSQAPAYIYGVSFCPGTSNYATTTYSYGLMNGTSKGDTIAYSIQVPNNPTKVWNAGESTYTATGTGVAQSIPVVATLVPGSTTDKYPAADNYLDTVVATISY
jgi:spore coat protein U-like protein